jgi:predicted  nucleic acid-binding Zn-ribbon protein
MKKWIEDLLKLQETDLRIRQLSTRLEMIPIEVSKIDKEIAEDAEQLQKTKENDMAAKLEIKQVESDIMQQNDEIEKLQKQSVMVKKNDEYKAMIKEINNAKFQISKLETRELELMDKIDEIKKSFQKEEKIAAERKNTLNGEKEDLIELETTIKAQIDKITAGRQELTKAIDDDVISLYTRLIGKGVGSPLVEVHNGNCGNCHLKLTPQTVNIARKQDIGTCENCGHLLYVAD